MKISDLLADVAVNSSSAPPEQEVAGIAVDSRLVRAGEAFVALVGRDSDGHQYLSQAAAQGAAVAVVERELAGLALPQVVVPSTRRALALMAAAWHGRPGRRMRVVGITGTDGKTTTSTLVGAIFEAAGYNTGVITTVAATIGGRDMDTGLHTTTPDPLDFHAFMAQMAAAGVTHAVVETTSHGLDQDRTLGAEYDVAAITNVTHEHLDYHGSFAHYRAAKAKLFQSLATTYRKRGVPKVAVLNVDDESYEFLRQFPGDVNLTYGLDHPADVRALDLAISVDGIRLHAATPVGEISLTSPLLGRYNAYNILAAVAVAVSQSVPAEAIVSGVAGVSGIAGRLDKVDAGQDFLAVVDFAHTPNALRRMLELARQLTKGRVIVTFGCAGLRDREKRPAMGEVAARLADLTVITSEDPRTEDPEAIMEAVAQGARRGGGREGATYWRIADRAEAIKFAVNLARPGDLVVTSGKGHEQSMCWGTTEYPWSEHEALREAIHLRLAGDKR
ncbi:MAG: UDP-N-acetylmuramoyl-L-alanyl-D-glutamate--2,6-diaminopimelate ligase [Chloroflexota bacterium]